jgi:uncharacterized protein with HEPN domain
VRDDGAYLEYIQESLGFVEEYLGGSTDELARSRFYTNRLIQDAVLRRLETLTDAAGHLSQELQQRHPELNWPRVTGFRNVLGHAYADLELDLIWRVIERDIPALQAVVESELA